MNDAEKIVAATLAAARCAVTGDKPREDYIVEYEAFLQILEQRGTKTAAHQSEKRVGIWEKLSGRK
jgi:hypothetical protein